MRIIYKFILNKICGWTIDYNGFESYKGNAMIIVAPHTSFIDGFIGKLALLITGWTHVILSAPWLFKTPPFCFVMRAINAIPVAGAKSIYKVVNILKSSENTKVIICPEGHLKYTPQWNLGFYYMAKKANVPIIVVTLNYKNKVIKFKDIISKEDISNKTTKEIMTIVYNLYNDNDTIAKYPEKFSLPEII